MYYEGTYENLEIINFNRPLLNMDVSQLFLPILLGLNLLLFKKKKEMYESFWKVYAHVEPIQIN